jgi:hypothetical protein
VGRRKVQPILEAFYRNLGADVASKKSILNQCLVFALPFTAARISAFNARLSILSPACSHTGTPPLPFLDHVGVGLFDERSDPRQRLAAPVTQFLSPPIDQLRGRPRPFPSVVPLFAFFMTVIVRPKRRAEAG